MQYVVRTVNDVSVHRVGRTIRQFSCWGATLLACASCSSDSPPTDGEGGGSGFSGSEVRAGASNRGGSAGRAGSTHSGAPGNGGSTAGVSGAAGDAVIGGSDTSAGASGTGGSGAGGTAGVADAGTGGTAGVGGTGTSGAAGISGAGNSGAAGVGGAGSGGASGGGTAGVSGAGIGGTVGAAGTVGDAGLGIGSGTGGVAGASGGFGGLSGAGGAQSNSFTLSTNSVFAQSLCPYPHPFTISNTSSGPLSWHLSGDLSTIDVSPLGSTLPVGGTVDVSVTSKWGVKKASPVVSVDADGAASQTVTVNVAIFGYFVDPPLPDIDFGTVILGQEASVFIPLIGSVTSVHLLSNNADFAVMSGAIPTQQPGGFGWTLIFRSQNGLHQTMGPQQARLDVLSSLSEVCPPNTSVARATVVAP